MNTAEKVSEINERQCILVVDNGLDMMKLLNRALEAEGYDTVVVADNDAALGLLGKLDPDLIIMDTDRTDEDALHTLDLMREQSNVPIVVLTSDNEVTTLKEAFEHGADDFIRKPFGVRLLIARIKAKLRRCKKRVRI